VESNELTHLIWPPSGDAVAVVTPDAATVVIGDRSGDVHMFPASSDLDSLLAESDDVGFLGHNSEVELLRVSPDGSVVASAAVDNSIRVWNVADGQPRPFFRDIAGNAITQLAFSPDSSLLAVLNGNRAQILDSATGVVIARFDLPEQHNAIAFANSDHLYVGGESGALGVIGRDSSGNWSLQVLWQGDSAIRWLEASPSSLHLVLVDQQNRARQFNLAEGQLGPVVLQFPDVVEEVSFSPGGSRVLFRTSRWLHRASVSVTGLIMLDSVMAPVTLTGARMVFGDAEIVDGAALGNRVFVATAGDSFARLVEMRFTVNGGAGLFGNKDELLDEWRRKLSVTEAVPVP